MAEILSNLFLDGTLKITQVAEVTAQPFLLSLVNGVLVKVATSNISTAVPVTSVFGRIGDVVAAANDYTFSQIGSLPTTIAGYGITDRSQLLAGTTVLPSLNIPIGVAPTTPVQGDIWAVSGSLLYKDGTASYNLLAPLKGTANNVLFYNNTGNLSSTTGFQWLSSGKIQLYNGLVTALYSANLITMTSSLGNRVDISGESVFAHDGLGSEVNISPQGLIAMNLLGVNTALLEISPSFATAYLDFAPLRFHHFTLLTSPLDGCMEFDGNHLYFDIGSTRYQLDQQTVTIPVTSVFGRTGAVVAAVNDYTFAQIGSLPTTLSGYGITDAYPLTGNPSGFLTVVPAQSFSSLTGIPTTLLGYGITDAYPLSGNPSNFITSVGAPIQSVSNSDSTLTISPTTGVVVASLNLANANIWTGIQTFNIDGLATTTSTILNLINNTAATSGATVQVSPAIVWTSQAWKSNATAASQIVNIRAYAAPVSSTTQAQPGFKIDWNTNGGAFTNLFLFAFSPSSGGNIISSPLGIAIIAGAGQVTLQNGSGVHISCESTNATNLKQTQVFVSATNATLTVGATTVTASSCLTAISTTRGFLPPKMTTTQKNAIASPAEGLIVYDSVLHRPFVYNGSVWQDSTQSPLLFGTAQTANYTLVAADAMAGVQMNMTSSNTVTVPPSSSVTFDIGTQIIVLQLGTGVTTVIAGVGVTLLGLTMGTTGQYGIRTLIKMLADTWLVC